MNVSGVVINAGLSVHAFFHNVIDWYPLCYGHVLFIAFFLFTLTERKWFTGLLVRS